MLFVFGGVALSPLQAAVRLPGVFGDNMVLQRGRPAPVWGWAAPGATVTVQFADQTRTAVASPVGQWFLTLESMKSNGTGQTMTIVSDWDKTPLAITNILVGDVWLCSGQSNMEVGIGSTLNAKEEIESANYPLIRHIKIERAFASSPAEDAKGRWRVSTPVNTHHYFSAVGYYFAREVYLKTLVPIGLVNASWGSTRIEPWMGPKEFRVAFQCGEVSSSDAKSGKQQPGGLYNAMIHPLLPYAICGVLWYQGESNVGEDVRNDYQCKMKALIQGWRRGWQRYDLPFYFVQLASFGKVSDDPADSGSWPIIREAQRQCLAIPKTGMAVTIDIGDAKNIHPRNKQDVGKRLSRWVLHDVHKEAILPSGPLYKNHEVVGDKVVISFDYVGRGLMVGRKQGLEPVVNETDSSLKRFAIMGQDQKWRWAKAVIQGKTVVVSHPEIREPTGVRYAYSMNPQGANLYNTDGLPASPFSTPARTMPRTATRGVKPVTSAETLSAATP